MNSPDRSKPESSIVKIGKNTTMRWECGAGDFVVWVPCPPLLGGGKEFDIADIWETREGDSVVISNKPEDFPGWFHLTLDEVSGARASEMVAKLRRGEIKPSDAVQAANVWRVPAGARLIWMGAKRPGFATFEGDHGVLQLLDFYENALVVGESSSMGWEGFAQFGALTKRSPSNAVLGMVDSAKKLVRQLGMPRVVGVDWTIG